MFPVVLHEASAANSALLTPEVAGNRQSNQNVNYIINQQKRRWRK